MTGPEALTIINLNKVNLNKVDLTGLQPIHPVNCIEVSRVVWGQVKMIVICDARSPSKAVEQSLSVNKSLPEVPIEAKITSETLSRSSSHRNYKDR